MNNFGRGPESVSINGRTVSSGAIRSESETVLLRSVFVRMALGLGVTALVSVFILNSPGFEFLFKPMILFPAMGIELGLVIWLSVRVMKMSPSKARGVFLAYSALNGITLAPLAMMYTSESIASAFFVSSGMFGAMALYGYTTKRDLSAWRSFLFMGLVGVVLASILSIFWSSSALMFGINIASIIVFTGLTAYDVNRIKAMSAMGDQGSDDTKRYAIIGALSLYLNFINLFITMLRLMGSRD